MSGLERSQSGRAICSLWKSILTCYCLAQSHTAGACLVVGNSNVLHARYVVSRCGRAGTESPTTSTEAPQRIKPRKRSQVHMQLNPPRKPESQWSNAQERSILAPCCGLSLLRRTRSPNIQNHRTCGRSTWFDMRALKQRYRVHDAFCSINAAAEALCIDNAMYFVI
jgi:hypothetical protein